MPAILVVDDEVKVRELLGKFLGARGYEVVAVPDPDQAIALVFQRPFDLILLDLKMSQGTSGFAVLQKVREAQSKLPIVIFSGAVTEDIEKEARFAGANEVLSKSTELPKLAEQIARIINAKERIFEDRSGLQGKTVLIVDDEEGVREVLGKFFRAKGFKTLEAESGEKAVSLCEENACGIALLDLKMPGLDGLQTLEKLLKINPSMGVVMVTGDGDDEKVKKAIELGAYNYVLKPFDFLYLELVVMSKLIIAGS